MKAIFTTGLIAALLAGPALAGSERGGCGYGAEASVSKAGQDARANADSQRSTAESEGVVTAQSSGKPTTIREDENVRSGGTRSGGSGAPPPNTVGK